MRAYVDGYLAGSEAQVQAHTPLLAVIVALTWALGVWAEDDDAREDEVRAALRHYREQVLAVMHEVRRVRFSPEAAVAAAVELERIERALEAAEGIEHE